MPISFWSKPQPEREIDVSKILKNASENKAAFERAIDGVCLMIVEKIEAGKRIEENFSVKIQRIIEGLRELAWPKNQTSYTSRTCTTKNPKEWLETLKELKGSSYRVEKNNLVHRQG